MDDNRVGHSTTGGVGFCGLLAIVFIVLKLTHVINWSWIWVLAPIWIGWALALIAIIVLLIIYKIRGSL